MALHQTQPYRQKLLFVPVPVQAVPSPLVLERVLAVQVRQLVLVEQLEPRQADCAEQVKAQLPCS